MIKRNQKRNQKRRKITVNKLIIFICEWFIQMKIKILKNQIKKIIKDAEIASKKNGLEICGLLIDNGYFIEIIPVNNKTKKGGGFEFYVNEIRFIQKASIKMDHEIIGTFHSHPLSISKPSESDINNALDDSYMLVIDVLDKKVQLWYIKDKNIKNIDFDLIQKLAEGILFFNFNKYSH